MRKILIAILLLALSFPPSARAQGVPCNRILVPHVYGTCSVCEPESQYQSFAIYINASALTQLPDASRVAFQIIYGDFIWMPPIPSNFHYQEWMADNPSVAQWASYQYQLIGNAWPPKQAYGMATYKDAGGCGTPPHQAIAVWWFEP